MSTFAHLLHCLPVHPMTNRREFLKAGVLLATAGLATATGALAASPRAVKRTTESVSKERKPPNIVFFLADQHRRQALGFWQKDKYKGLLNGTSDPVYTPNLDAFAEQSVVLSQCIATSPICSPHRAMMFSGLFPHVNGVPQNCRADREWGLLRKVETLSDVLSNKGYSCGYIGKWHLDKPLPNDPANPGKYVVESEPGRKGKRVSTSMDSYTPPEDRHGFDFWYAFGAHSKHDNPHYYDTHGKRHESHQWATKHETDIAISYLRNEHQQRDEDRPFCLFVSTNLPHNPYSKLKDTDEDMYFAHYSPARVPDVYDLLNRPNHRHGPLPMKMGSPEANSSEGLSTDCVRYYFSSISGVDRQFGRLMKALNDIGEYQNTIVVYSSDHGDMMGSHGLMAKTCIYEEAIGIPMMVRYPQRVKPGVNDVLMGSMDFMPTLLGLAGFASDIPAAVSGNDLSDILTGSDGNKPSSVPFLLHTNQKGLRTDRYSFVMNKYGNGVLFDNREDPYQMNNLFSKESDIVKTLGKELGTILRKSNDLWYQQRINKDVIHYL